MLFGQDNGESIFQFVPLDAQLEVRMKLVKEEVTTEAVFSVV